MAWAQTLIRLKPPQTIILGQAWANCSPLSFVGFFLFFLLIQPVELDKIVIIKVSHEMSVFYHFSSGLEVLLYWCSIDNWLHWGRSPIHSIHLFCPQFVKFLRSIVALDPKSSPYPVLVFFANNKGIKKSTSAQLLCLFKLLMVVFSFLCRPR